MTKYNVQAAKNVVSNQMGSGDMFFEVRRNGAYIVAPVFIEGDENLEDSVLPSEGYYTPRKERTSRIMTYLFVYEYPDGTDEQTQYDLDTMAIHPALLPPSAVSAMLSLVAPESDLEDELTPYVISADASEIKEVGQCFILLREKTNITSYSAKSISEKKQPAIKVEDIILPTLTLSEAHKMQAERVNEWERKAHEENNVTATDDF